MPKLINAKVKTQWVGLTPRPDKFFGFVYQIVDLTTGMMYIGKKQYHKLNPKRSRKKPICDTSGAWNPLHWRPSDWLTYTGSCNNLNADIAKKGIENFKFFIIGQYSCKGDLSYAEVEAIIKHDALTLLDKDGERVYYNGNVGAIRFIPPNKEKELL